MRIETIDPSTFDPRLRVYPTPDAPMRVEVYWFDGYTLEPWKRYPDQKPVQGVFHDAGGYWVRLEPLFRPWISGYPPERWDRRTGLPMGCCPDFSGWRFNPVASNAMLR